MEAVEILCRVSGEKGALREAGERIMWVSLGQWSSVPELPPRRHLAISGCIFGCYVLVGRYSGI